MPNIAISALPVATSQAGADVLPIVQATTSTTKQLSVTNLFTSPTFVTPALGTVASGNISACTSTSMVMVTPVLGTPTSGVVTNLTGTASININGTVGATTPAAGAFTTVSATGVATFAAGTVALPSITTIGDTNTGVYFPSADTVGVATGGAQRSAFSSTGLAVTGALSATGKVSATPGNNLEAFSVSGATTGYTYNIISNTGGSAILGVDSSTGGTLFFLSAAYDTVLRAKAGTGVAIGVEASVNGVRVSSTGLAVAGVLTSTGTISPQQATTAGAPAYVKGAIYFDTTLNKLRVGGATAWETITSV